MKIDLSRPRVEVGVCVASSGKSVVSRMLHRMQDWRTIVRIGWTGLRIYLQSKLRSQRGFLMYDVGSFSRSNAQLPSLFWVEFIVSIVFEVES